MALNGVLFQKNGQISGGGEELSRKAARWKERELESFRRAYEEKMREHRETCTRKRDTNEKWLELGKQCASLETQLRHSENSLRQLQSKVCSSHCFLYYSSLNALLSSVFTCSFNKKFLIVLIKSYKVNFMIYTEVCTLLVHTHTHTHT